MIQNNDAVTSAEVDMRCSIEKPRLVFLTGANVLQTQANAATNGGCGLIAVSEIKSGKCRYTDADGSYGRMLDFYEGEVAARSFRKADDIPKIAKCGIHMVAAGVKED